MNECISENVNKELEEYREPTSQTKRRRMLQFNTQVIDPCFCNEELPSAFVKSKVSGAAQFIDKILHIVNYCYFLSVHYWFYFFFFIWVLFDHQIRENDAFHTYFLNVG
uniref:Uncharacterized protein n=1 Tax=Nelumbo nucifera TaxID=4432 RepID=A0A822XW54_NELNU|nr:TPA_asm: hypothetical protein HUJ06_025436 [Nelumbo nucifera]